MANAADKPLVWLSREVKSPPFSTAARLEAGFLLRRLQRGEKLGPPHSRPMRSIGKRCHELRVPDEDLTWRIIHRIDADAIVLAEIFAKKTTRTPKRIIELQPAAEALRRGGEGGQMKRKKRDRLKRAGWRVGTAEDFLGLSPEEARFVELKLSLSEAVRRSRSRAGLSQEELAKRIGSSQSRVSKMEKADPTVSVDLLVRSMLAAGATRRDIAAAIGSKSRRRGS